jgi:4-amino-4-deoxy-L-arabinose transferase-like glycosyltransferase
MSSRRERLSASARALVRSPLAWVVLFVGLLRVVAIDWGLPSSDGWDNDGVAPRDFLPGLIATFSPGKFYTYPPVHLALLAVLTLPITLVMLARAPSLDAAAVVAEAIKTPYMTATAYVARFVSLALSLGIVIFAARVAEEMRRGERDARLAGTCTAVFVGLNVSLTYYAHTSNLDVPYMFWSMASFATLARAMGHEEPRLLRRALVFAVLAIGTKDQAYALFVIAFPIALAWWVARDRRVAREAAIALGLAALLFLVVDAVVINPTGFRARLAFLTGSASQDYAEYTNDWPGRLRILVDLARKSGLQYPAQMAPLVAIGLLSVARRPRFEALLPLLGAISFTIAFNFTARRTDPRFFLPQGVMLGIYGGLGLGWLVRFRPPIRVAGYVAAAFALARGLFACISVDVNMLRDPRYDAEAWLRAHVRPGDTIETYGHNVYLPRMTDIARVVRVGPEPVQGRNPMPGIEEAQAPYELAAARGARFVVVPTAWVWRYMNAVDLSRGRMLAPTLERSAADEGAVRYFNGLLRGEQPFTLVHDSRYDDLVFPIQDVHGTTTRWVWIFERRN